MSNITNTQKLYTSILVLKGMEGRHEASIEAGISKTWLNNQKIIQEAIIRDYRTKVEAEKSQ